MIEQHLMCFAGLDEASPETFELLNELKEVVDNGLE